MMNFQRGFAGVAIAAMLLTGLSGCQTTGEAAGLGALIGAGVGAIVGGETGAIVGAAVGAASGAIAHDVRETRAEKNASAEVTYQRYAYRPPPPPPPRGPRPPRARRPAGPPPPAVVVAPIGTVSLVFEQSAMTPMSVRRGTMVEATMQYAVLGAGPGREVTETRIIKAGQEIVSQVSSQSFTRNDGTWVSRQEFRIPDSWQPGEYTLEQVVQSGETWVSGTVTFYVR